MRATLSSLMQELSLRSGPSAAAAARATLATWFASRVSDPVLRDAQLIVSEVVGGAGSGEPRLQLKAGLDVEVLRVELQAPAQMSGSLRRVARSRADGLFLAEALSSRWGIELGATTRVWFEVAAREPQRSRAA